LYFGCLYLAERLCCYSRRYDDHELRRGPGFLSPECREGSLSYDAIPRVCIQYYLDLALVCRVERVRARIAWGLAVRQCHYDSKWFSDGSEAGHSEPRVGYSPGSGTGSPHFG